MPAIDNNFVLIGEDGSKRYPFKKAQKQTGRYGFALSTTENRDRHGGGVYTDDISEVVRKAVLEGWKVRACSEDGATQGSIGLGKRSFRKYWVAPSLRPLVVGATFQPEDRPPGE